MKKFLERSIEIGPYINWMKLQFIPKHKISYLEYGVENSQIIICAHGLTRNAHDFDKIAQSLAKDYHVISISYPGRGNSDHFKNKNHYNYHVYGIDSIKLIKKLKITNPIWLGTSMGGLIGMIVASQRKNMVKGLILNDVGPSMPVSTVKKIRQYAKKVISFNNLETAKKHLKLIYNDFGIKEEKDWNYLTKYSFIKNDNQKYILNYDPAIVKGIDLAPTKNKKNIEAWWLWDRVKTKILVIHGEKSNILLPEILQKMQDTKKIDIFTVEGVGHAPALLDSKQIEVIKNWIDKTCQELK